MSSFSPTSNPKTLRIVLVSVLIVLVAGAATWFFVFRAPGAEASAEVAGVMSSAGLGPGDGAATVPVSGTTFEVALVNDRQGVEIAGNLEPGLAENVLTAAAGTIESVLVEEGQDVGAGQLLLTVDNRDLLYDIASLEYDLEQERLSGSPRKLQLLTMQYALLTDQLADYRLTSPIAGRVSAVEFEAGQVVSKGQIAVRVIDTSTMEATVEVDELDVPKLGLGQEVEVILDALPALTLFGTVESIGIEGTATGNGYAVVPVILNFPEPDSRIVPGFSFSGSIFTASEEDALVVDRRAIQTITDTRGIVFIVNENSTTASPVPVEYESFGQLQYKIVSGVDPGAVLMTPPADAITAGGIGGFRLPGMGGGTGRPPSGGAPSGAAPPAARN